jgi:hypothetical protein
MGRPPNRRAPQRHEHTALVAREVPKTRFTPECYEKNAKMGRVVDALVELFLADLKKYPPSRRS